MGVVTILVDRGGGGGAVVFPENERGWGGGVGPAPHSVFSSDCQPFGRGPQADRLSV